MRRDPARLAAIERIVCALAGALGPSPYAFRVHVVDDPVVNAFAVPGGGMVLFRGLVEAARTPEELAGVLAHEMSHVVHRHGTRALIRELSLRALVAIVTGNVAGLEQALGTAGQLGGLRYRRSDELEADRAAVALLAAAQIDPAGMVRAAATARRYAAANSVMNRATDRSNSRMPATVAYSLGLCGRPPCPSPPMTKGWLSTRRNR